jgi:hypothetical protein
VRVEDQIGCCGHWSLLMTVARRKEQSPYRAIPPCHATRNVANSPVFTASIRASAGNARIRDQQTFVSSAGQITDKLVWV